jgi:hypothetical protein
MAQKVAKTIEIHSKMPDLLIHLCAACSLFVGLVDLSETPGFY